MEQAANSKTAMASNITFDGYSYTNVLAHTSAASICADFLNLANVYLFFVPFYLILFY